MTTSNGQLISQKSKRIKLRAARVLQRNGRTGRNPLNFFSYYHPRDRYKLSLNVTFGDTFKQVLKSVRPIKVQHRNVAGA